MISVPIQWQLLRRVGTGCLLAGWGVAAWALSQEEQAPADSCPPQVEVSRSALAEAAWRGDGETCRRLIAAGAEVNALGSDGWAPLHAAVYHRHVEICRLLLEAGGEADVRSAQGEIPSFMAIDAGADVAGLGDDERPEGEEEKPAEMLRLLLAAGADPNATRAGLPLLHYAIWSGCDEFCRLLLEAGADATVRDPQGNTPVEAAREMDEPEIVELLESFVREGATP